MHLNDLQREAYQVAVARGQWPTASEDVIVGALMHAVSEIGEVFREIRHCRSPIAVRYVTVFGELPKPEGIPIELADVVICMASIAQALNIDLAAAVTEKMAYNRTRIPDAVGG